LQQAPRRGRARHKLWRLAGVSDTRNQVMRAETGYFGHGTCRNLLMADRTKSVET
jgi:hypothetical protein